MNARLYVGNLSYDVDAERLSEIFKEFGFAVTGPHIVMDRETQRSKGFGFVDIPDKDADHAISQMNGAYADGRTMRVDRAAERPNGGGQSKGGQSKNSQNGKGARR